MDSICSEAEHDPVPYCDCISICDPSNANLRSLVTSYQASCPDIISQLTSASYVMLLNSKPTTVGRTIDKVMSQKFPAGTNRRISRKHFTITFDSNGNFMLLCLSKNGIIIDEKFCSKQEQPYILPQHCIIRFPSTTDVIHFRSLIAETTILAYKDAITASAAYKDGICNLPSNVNPQLVPLSSEEDTATHMNSAQRPPYSYSQLIIQAISASPQKRLPLCKIYSFIMEKYPYYREFGIKSWQNSIRHNLSMKSYFLKTPQEEPKIGHLWMLSPSCEERLVAKRFLERRISSHSKNI